MTQSITFTQDFGYPGQSRASLTVEVVPSTGGKYAVPVILDTGAAISVFDHSLSARMGIPNVSQNHTRTIQTLTASKQPDTGFVHVVEIVFLGRTIKIPVAFVPSWPAGTPNLLGMEGFFEQGIFAFDHVKRTVYIRI